MHCIISRLVLTTIISISMILPVMAEAVFMKNGPIIVGKITSETADSISITTTDGKTSKIKRGDILRILYTKLKMGKVFIQKRDGKALTAYIVDEDQDSYTCRNDLNKRDEFVIKRSDVLFMAEKNPSGLQPVGDIGTDRVSLTWLPPYGDVSKYNIYIKKDDKAKYELVDSAKGKTVTVKNLASNTLYYLIVTSVDDDNYESSPSNELKITTANIHPDRPVITSAEKNSTGRIKIAWEPSVDPDGKVVKYRIYANRKNKRERIAEFTATEYTFSNPESFDSADLVAVDNNGDESEPTRLPVSDRYFTIGVRPGAALPLGKFGKITGPGFGASAAVAINNSIIDNLRIGADISFYSFTGKDALASEYKKTEKVYLASFILNAGYNFQPSYSFSMTPFIGAGVSYFYADYTSRSRVTLIDKKEKTTDIGPSLWAGIDGGYRINESLKVVLRVSAGNLTGADSGLFIATEIGCTYRL
jgi:fibronectin type 3 domain-containing protein